MLKHDLSKLEVFQMHCLQCILCVSLCDRHSNDTILTSCGSQLTIGDLIQTPMVWQRLSNGPEPLPP